MTTATVNVRTLNRKIARYVEAAIEESWVGSKHPEDVPYVLAEFLDAKRDLGDYIVHRVKEPS
mgnify:CR=1 FL=1